MRRLGVVGLATLLLGITHCAGDEEPPQKGLETAGTGGMETSSGGRAVIGVAGKAGGGAGGAAGAATAGTLNTAGTPNAAGGGLGGTSSAGTAGQLSVPTLPPVVCEEAPPACPPMVIDGDVRANSDTPASLVAGVTEITGELDISRGQDLSAFDCLETVGDNIELDADEGDALEGAFPRLTTMGGGVRISGGLSEVSVSCAFRALTTIGTYWLNGGHVDVSGDITGELDLASLVEFHSIRINNTKIERVILPSNGTFSILQLKFDADPRLSEVLGLENTTLVGRAEDDTYTLLIRNNPLLSGCRAQAIGQMFLDGGYTPASVIVENNGPGCE